MLCPARKARLGVLAALGSCVVLASLPVFSQRKPKTKGGRTHETAQGVLDLYEAETVHFSAPPPVAVLAGIKCDLNGNIYANYTGYLPVVPGRPGYSSIGRAPLSEILVRSKKVVQYPLPTISDYSNLIRYSFDVTGDGDVYALVDAAHSESDAKPKGEFLIVKYNHDGTMDSYVKIGDMAGTRIQPWRMAVFGDGSFLLSGLTIGRNRKGFSGIFDRQGTFVAPLKLGEAFPHTDGPPGAAGTVTKAAKKAPGSAGEQSQEAEAVTLAGSTYSVSSPDGNVYLIRGRQAPTLYGVSPAGYVVRTFRLKPPAPGLSPLQLATAGLGYLFIYWAHIATGAPGENVHQRGMITVLNPETGRLTALYRMPESKAGLVVPACADSPGDFLFLGTSKDNRLAVVRYVAR